MAFGSLFNAIFFRVCAVISLLYDIFWSITTVFVLKKNIERWKRREQVGDRIGGSNWTFRMIFFVQSLYVTISTLINLKLPALLGHTQWFENTFANQTEFQSSPWHTILRISYGSNYAASFFGSAVILAFLVTRLMFDKWETQFRKIEALIIAACLLFGILMGLPANLEPAYFKKMDSGVYVLHSNSTWMNCVVAALIFNLGLIGSIGVVIIVMTYRKLQKHVVEPAFETTPIGIEQRKIENERKMRDFLNSSAVITLVFFVGFVNTTIIRLSIVVKPMKRFFEPAYAFLTITSSGISFSLLQSLYIVHRQTRYDVQECWTYIFPRCLCPDEWKRDAGVVETIGDYEIPALSL